MSIYGRNPIGAFVYWNKSATNMPSLAAQGMTEYLECNGQVLQDAASGLNGQTMPTVNSANRYLRGNTTSGTTSGVLSHTHSITLTTGTAQSGSGQTVVTSVSSPTAVPSSTPVVVTVDAVCLYRYK